MRVIAGIGLSLLFLSRYSFAQFPVFYDVTIQMSDSIGIEATITEPLGLPPSGGFPGIVLVHGFGGNKDDLRLVSFALASYGYASIAYSVRGQGNSGGVSTVDGDRERQDLLEVIQYFRNVSQINPDNLGVAGGSQGGIHSWMAAAYRMPGVKAIAPLIATPDFAKALTPNGCIKYGLPREMTLGTVRYGSERDRVRDFIIADRYDSVSAYIEARDLLGILDSVRIPVFQALGWADFLFPSNGALKAREQLAARHVPVWSYFGTNGHGEPTDTSEAAFILNKAVAWFDHWLKGFALDGDSVPLVFYSDDRPGWPHHTTTTWPPLPSSTLRLYISQEGLWPSPGSDSIALPFSLLYDSEYTPAMAWDDRYGGPGIVTAFTGTPIRLVSTALGSDIEITGVPTGRIFVSSDAEQFQVHMRFFDVTDTGSGGTWRLMSRSTNGIRGNVSGQVHQVSVEGTACSHVIPAGHRIGVEITSLDMLDPAQAYTIPYFLPSRSLLLASASALSYIDLPIVGDNPLTVEESRPVPDRFELMQNFPNPFNPKTVISYSLSVNSSVSLKMYDVMGREVARIVSEAMPAGTYARTWDASGAASGVYFCRMEVKRIGESRPKFIDVKKMLLLR